MTPHTVHMTGCTDALINTTKTKYRLGTIEDDGSVARDDDPSRDFILDHSTGSGRKPLMMADSVPNGDDSATDDVWQYDVGILPSEEVPEEVILDSVATKD